MHGSQFKFVVAAAIATTGPFICRAQDNSQSEWNHFGLDARLGLNIHARFINAGATALPAPPSSGGDVNRTYADGFVNSDFSGNQGGLTWNWGYQNAAQVPGNGFILMHASSVGQAVSTERDDPNPGFEFSYLRDCAHTEWGSWGFKFAFGFTRINLQQNQAQTADTINITDSYALGGVQVPLAPYSGSFNGPGATIGSTPTRTSNSVPGGAIITGNRGLDTTLYDFRIGPSIDIRLAENLSLQLGGGLALGIADGRFSFAETTTTASGSAFATGQTDKTGCTAGAYLEAELSYRFWGGASILTGVEFQYLGDFQEGTAGRAARLDLGQSIFCKAGFRWSF